MEPCQAGGKQTKRSDRTLHVHSHRKRKSSRGHRACYRARFCLVQTTESLALRHVHTRCSWNGSWLLARRCHACWELVPLRKWQAPLEKRENVFKRFSQSLVLFITSQQLQRGVAACNCGHRSFGPKTTNQDGFLFPLHRLTMSESWDLEMGHYLTWTRSDVKEH